MALIIATNVNTSSANAFTFANAGDELFVPANIHLFATGDGFSAVVSAVGAIVENHGQLLGNINGILLNAAPGQSVSVTNGADGTISSYGPQFNAGTGIRLSNGGLGTSVTLNNAGQILATGTSLGVDIAGAGTLTNSGVISSVNNRAISLSNLAINETFNLVNTETGIISGSSFTGAFAAPGASAGSIVNINNRGVIQGGVNVGAGFGSTMTNSGSGSIVGGTVTFLNGDNDRFQNFGSMGALFMGNGNGDNVLNFGTIGSITIGNGNGDFVGNAGRINGNVALGNGLNQVFDSSNGTAYNPGNPKGRAQIVAGSTGATLVGSLNGCDLNGGSGNDILIANQSTSSAFNYNARFELNGGAGTNALYGGAGTNVFFSGNATYNQIWGGLSALDENYSNNTLDYGLVSGAGKSVYVDLLKGHNAYIVNNGVYTYEDSIVFVPNVSGSAGADIIQCDNAEDVINGQAGGDSLYAGTGNFRGADTFVYTKYADSNVVNGYDTIVGFRSGLDKIDVSALHLTPAQAQIQFSAGSTALYLEQTAGSFNPNTDLAISFTTQNALTTADIIF